MSKTLHINQIEQGLAKVRKLGHLEDTFEVLGMEVTIRTVERHEMEAANQVCHPLFELSQENEDTFSFSNWIQALKIETLSYAIMRINEIDFHDVDYITTDEVDEESGRYVKKQKHVFLRELLASWEDSVIDTIFKKFNELTDQASTSAAEGVEFAENEDKARIEELESELADLKIKMREKEAREEAKNDVIDKDVLKKQVFSNPSEETNKVEEREYLYETPEPPKKSSHGSQEPKQRNVSRPTQDSKHNQDQRQNQYLNQNQEEHIYYNEDGDPLVGEELEAAKAQDRLMREREKKASEAQARTEKTRGVPRGREPLNQVDAQVKGGHGGPQRTKNANKRQHESEPVQIDPTLSDGNVEVLTKRQQVAKGNPNLNEGPSKNINPNFQPPSARNRGSKRGGNNNQ